MPDRARLFSGMREILSQPCKIPTNYFAVGGCSVALLMWYCYVRKPKA